MMRFTGKLRAPLLLALLLVLVTGCAGSRHRLKFAGLRYPASMSGYLQGPDGRVLPREVLEETGTLNEKVKFWGMMWALVPMGTAEKDAALSAAMNRAIEAHNGEGIINLQITSDSCGINMTPILDLLPFWPGCTVVQVQGAIVRRTTTTATVQPAPSEMRDIRMKQAATP